MQDNDKVCFYSTGVFLLTGTPEAIKATEGGAPALIQALTDPDADIRTDAGMSLAFIGTPGALNAVREYQLIARNTE